MTRVRFEVCWDRGVYHVVDTSVADAQGRFRRLERFPTKEQALRVAALHQAAWDARDHGPRLSRR